MAIRDFTRETRTVLWGERGPGESARRISVRKPTCQTIFLASALFGREIAAAWMTWEEAPAAARARAVDLFLPMFIDPARTPLVLASCCELWQGAPGELEELLEDPGLVRLVVDAIFEISNIPLICLRMGVEAMGKAAKERVEAMAAGPTPTSSESQEPTSDSPEPDAHADRRGGWPPGFPRPEMPAEEGDGEPAGTAFEAMLELVASQFPGTRASDVMTWPYEEVTGIMNRWGRRIEKEQEGDARPISTMDFSLWRRLGVKIDAG